jgi:hypothetical protein
MTNILLLPQIRASFVVVSNGDWRDEIEFTQAPVSLLPLDITGIAFHAQMRSAIRDAVIVLDMSTTNGKLQNGGANGRLTWAVPADDLKQVSGDYVMDILAIADGMTINICQKAGPAAITVNKGVTR